MSDEKIGTIEQEISEPEIDIIERFNSMSKKDMNDADEGILKEIIRTEGVKSEKKVLAHDVLMEKLRAKFNALTDKSARSGIDFNPAEFINMDMMSLLVEIYENKELKNANQLIPIDNITECFTENFPPKSMSKMRALRSAVKELFDHTQIVIVKPALNEYKDGDSLISKSEITKIDEKGKKYKTMGFTDEQLASDAYKAANKELYLHPTHIRLHDKKHVPKKRIGKKNIKKK